MQLSRESYRTRWLVLVATWTAAAIALVLFTRVISDYLDIEGALGLRGAPAANTPLKAPYPAFAADGQVWVRHALSLLEGTDIQLRHTDIDNAPEGREVHWNSAWAWTIAAAGKLQQMFTGAPLTTSVEMATRWLNPTVLFVLMVVFSTWTTRRAGVIAGVVVATAMICKDRMYEGFFPTYVDHHGLLTMAAFGTLLGAVFMGGGWWQKKAEHEWSILPDSPEVAREGALFSAICGACGMWVSAASTIPPIGIVGVSGLLAVIIHGRTARRQGATFDPSVWRLWGRVGAVASFGFYLVEYFPRHLGLRLEANHPFYSLAWLAGGELIAQGAERWLAPPERRWENPKRLVWPLLALAVVPLTIAIGRSKVFVLMDPFLANLHHDYIQEFLPIWKTIRGLTGAQIMQVVGIENIPLIAAIATLTYRRSESPIVLWFTTVASLLFNIMGWLESRWLLNASGPQVCLTLVVLACWLGAYRPLVRWGIALATVAILFVPSGVSRYSAGMMGVTQRRVEPRDANNMLNRDIAAVLRASQPQGEMVVLASPNASTSIGYYGRFKTLGTLYWENNAGLKKAAEILSARSEAEAAALLKKYHVTHLALISEENFIPQYYMLLHPTASVDDIKKCFGWQVLYDKAIPQWLQILPYKMPDDLASLKYVVMLFKVDFNQNAAQALYNIALAQITEGSFEAAERSIDTLIQQAPQNHLPWMRKAELLIARHEWQPAYDAAMKGISLAPPAERANLYTTAARAFYTQHQHAFAIRIYTAALNEKFDPDAACYLAWVLATSPNDSLRNGKVALQLAQEGLKAAPTSVTYLLTLAAAMAENGNFAEGANAADRALANAQLKGDPQLVRRVEERLQVLRAGKPIREE